MTDIASPIDNDITSPVSLFEGTPGLPGSGGGGGGGGSTNILNSFESGSDNFLGIGDLPGITSALPSNAKDTTSTSGQTGFGAEAADLFFRAVIIITGFIFLAIGLSMFKTPFIAAPIRGIKHVGKTAHKIVKR